MDGVTVRERVRELREEIAQINRLNKEYRQRSHHSVTEIKMYSYRRDRLVAIARELAALNEQVAGTRWDPSVVNAL
jgi:hypothetical protein